MEVVGDQIEGFTSVVAFVRWAAATRAHRLHHAARILDHLVLLGQRVAVLLVHDLQHNRDVILRRGPLHGLQLLPQSEQGLAASDKRAPSLCQEHEVEQTRGRVAVLGVIRSTTCVGSVQELGFGHLTHLCARASVSMTAGEGGHN